MILLPGNGKGYWIVMEPPAARAQKLAYFQIFITEEVAEQVEGFSGLTRSELTLDRWAGVFQVLKLGSIILLAPDVLNSEKGEIP